MGLICCCGTSCKTSSYTFQGQVICLNVKSVKRTLTKELIEAVQKLIVKCYIKTLEFDTFRVLCFALP